MRSAWTFTTHLSGTRQSSFCTALGGLFLSNRQCPLMALSGPCNGLTVMSATDPKRT